MKFCVLALDYDGTIAENGNPHLPDSRTIRTDLARGLQPGLRYCQ